MRDNPIQFAVVREDPAAELELIRKLDAKRVLLIGSGGCTAFTIAAHFPQCELSIIDPNPAQLALIKLKIDNLGDNTFFNIENTDPRGLNTCGNFESLFRGFATFIDEMVCPRAKIEQAFREKDLLVTLREQLFSSAYWPVAFQMFFCDPLLGTMFGPDAIQHAPKGSYPTHFQNALTFGLSREDAFDNYFLHHIFLGCYINRPAALPDYLRLRVAPDKITLTNSTLQGVPSFADFDLIHLSNVFDWSSEADIAKVAGRLSTEMHQGSALVLRQLNHDTDFSHFFGPQIRFQPDLERDFLQKDRSLFYSRLNIGVRE